KNKCVSSGATHLRRRVASSSAGSCVKPARITCSILRACSAMAAAILGFPCPCRFTHHDDTASIMLRPSFARSHTPSARSISIGGGSSAEFVKGCQMRRGEGILGKLLRKRRAVKVVHEHLHQRSSMQILQAAQFL